MHQSQPITVLLAVTSLPPPAAVAAAMAPALLLLLHLLHQVGRRSRALGRVRVLVAAQSHRIGYHRGDVIGGAELGPWDGDITIWVLQ